MKLYISHKVRQKLARRHITKDEIIQCFSDRQGTYLIDDREEHRTDPPSKWFVAETDYGKALKIVFIQNVENGKIYIKTAYEATNEVIWIYKQNS